jgi:hypothetical protein
LSSRHRHCPAHSRIARSCGLGAAAWVLLASAPALAGSFTPTSQLREVRSQTTDATTGYTCLVGGGGTPLPGCPIDLGTTTTQDVHTAPGFAAFDQTASTAGGATAQTSSIAPGAVLATGTASANASASEGSDPCCLFVLRTVDPQTANDFELTFDLDAPTAFSFQASGWIEHPDPSYPVTGAGLLDIQLDGPAGSLGSLHASFDPACSVSPSFGVCRVEPAPLLLSGTLPAGSYTIDVHLETSAAGSWLPSTGPLAGFGTGAFDVSLALDTGASVPALDPTAAGGLFLLLAAAGTLSIVLATAARRPRA